MEYKYYTRLCTTIINYLSSLIMESLCFLLIDQLHNSVAKLCVFTYI